MSLAVAELNQVEERAISDVACSHCRLPVPRSLLGDGAGPQFCCSGCRTVYRLLHDEGLEQYYRLQDAAAERPAEQSGRAYAEFDDSAFAQLHVTLREDGLREITLYVSRMHCTACVWLIEKLPRLQPGVVEARATLGASNACIVWDPNKTSLSAVAQRIDSFGYPVQPFRGAERRALEARESRELAIRIGVAGACAGNIMLLAFALYSGMFGSMSSGHESFLRWLSFAVTLPAVVYGAAPFYRGAWGSLRGRSLHMDLPIAIGITAGFAWGTVNTLRGAGEIYFDTVAVLIFLLLIGRWIQRRQQRKAGAASELLYSLVPHVARVIDGSGKVTEVPVEAITAGTRIDVRAGDTIPVDGVVAEGLSSVDASWLTGESRPIDVGPGDLLRAGTTNLGAPLQLVAQATGEATQVGQLMQEVARAAQDRAPIVRMADRLVGAFVVSALFLAVLTTALWAWRGNLELGIEQAIALLVVTCPCALGLATPLALAVAVGRGARAGILIKGGSTLESLAKPGQLFVDKTGTLTQGKMAVVAWHGDAGIRGHVAAIESGSAHPVARALASAAEFAEAPTAFEETLGGGVRGECASRAFTIGSPRFVEHAGNVCPESLAKVIDEISQRGNTPVAVAESGSVIAIAELGDPIRPDAAKTVATLRERGWQVKILSGDHPLAVRAVGSALTLAEADCIGGVSPEQKLEVVRAARATGSVVMVGDGVNDAAAMAAAHCGIAVHGSAEASLRVADVFVGTPGVAAVADVIRAGEQTVRVIRRNLAFSLAYNVVGAALAMIGVLHPLVAAVVMPASSITVITSSLRTPAFRRAKEG